MNTKRNQLLKNRSNWMEFNLASLFFLEFWRNSDLQNYRFNRCGDSIAKRFHYFFDKYWCFVQFLALNSCPQCANWIKEYSCVFGIVVGFFHNGRMNTIFGVMCKKNRNMLMYAHGRNHVYEYCFAKHWIFQELFRLHGQYRLWLWFSDENANYSWISCVIFLDSLEFRTWKIRYSMRSVVGDVYFPIHALLLSVLT